MKVTRKNLLRTIQNSLGRFVAIMAIIALGAAMFVGLLITKSDMIATGQKFMDQQNMFDLKLYSTYGWTQADVDKVAQMPGVQLAEGMICMDVIGQRDEDKAAVYKVHALPEQIDQVYLLGGRMPENADECVVDGFHVTDAVLGTEFVITGENDQDTLDGFVYDTYTVVGYVSSPLYMDMNRGTTSLGNGSVAGYVYLPAQAFQVDYYTDISVTMHDDYTIYTDAFDEAMQALADQLEPHVTVLANERYASVKDEAEKEYAQGWTEYQDGLAEYAQKKQEALQELEDALQELTQAQTELDDNRALLEDGQAQLTEGQAQLDAQEQLLNASRQELADAKAEAYSTMAAAYAQLMENYKLAYEGLQQVNDGLAQIDDGLVQIDSGIVQLQSGLQQLEDGKSQLQLGLSLKELQVKTLESSLKSPLLTEDVRLQLQKQLETAQQELQEYQAQAEELAQMQVTYSAQLEALEQQKLELNAQRSELEATKVTLNDALETIDLGILELQSSQTQADNQFIAAEAQMQSGQLQLEAAQKELNAKQQELDAGLLALQEAQAQLDEGWAEYESGKAQADRELADGEEKLAQAAAELTDARQLLDDMEPGEAYVMDRNTNSGYVSLYSNSNIVEGVSRVFPAFFLLVAALVCITTMTRMVEEERMQIGTMKALGYSGGAIISKYLLYAGFASVVGCGLGVFLGSVAFPVILWDVYGIILNIMPNIVLGFNWPLSLTVVGSYTTVMLLVTWYCCRRCLKEVPAELLRPKAPTTGKKIFLEYFPFWKRIRFLNKVMLRNVFRYRQRMFMMLVGIGGCTALLLTGFGLRDSIMNIVTEQFQQVTVYDMNVYFDKVQTQQDQEAFCQELRKELSKSLFYYQISADLEVDGKQKELSLIAADEGLTDFIHLRENGEPLALPGTNEVLLSAGIADQMDIQVGDPVLLWNADMKKLELTVAGIFDNHVNAYAIVLPQTIENQWAETAQPQMAFLNIRDTADLYEVAAKVSGMDDVLNVGISQDLQDQVNGMLQALNLVVATVVVCAGALAVIVLYNLTNINITERIREIATLKVLGFYAGESAAYVFKENLLLSGMGTLVGLVGGKFLLDFVISQVKVDMVHFDPSFTVLSAVLSVALTMLAACLVDFLLYFKLEKINMAEALKSVE